MRSLVSCDFTLARHSSSPGSIELLGRPPNSPFAPDANPSTCSLVLSFFGRWRVFAQPSQDSVHIGMDSIYAHSIDLGAGIQGASSHLVKQAKQREKPSEQTKHRKLHEYLCAPRKRLYSLKLGGNIFCNVDLNVLLYQLIFILCYTHSPWAGALWHDPLVYYQYTDTLPVGENI